MTIRSYFRRRRTSHRRFYIAHLKEACTSIRKPPELINSGTLSTGLRAGVSGFPTVAEITLCTDSPGPAPEHRIGQDNMLWSSIGAEFLEAVTTYNKETLSQQPHGEGTHTFTFTVLIIVSAMTVVSHRSWSKTLGESGRSDL